MCVPWHDGLLDQAATPTSPPTPTHHYTDTGGEETIAVTKICHTVHQWSVTMTLYFSCQLRLLGNKFNNCTVQYMQEEVNYDWLYGVQIVSFSIAVDNENNFSRILEGNRRTKRRTRNSWSWTRLKVSQWLKKFSLLTSCDNITSGIMIQLNFYPLNICKVVNYMQKWVINILTMNHVIYLSQPGHVIFFSTSQV